MKNLGYPYLTLLLLTLQSNLLFGQDCGFLTKNQISEYLKNSSVNQKVKDYYNGKLIPSDNDLTFELLKSLTEKNDELFPVHFNALNEIINIADGALAEMISTFCVEMIVNYPQETFKYFMTNHEISMKYARSIGYELYFVEQGTSSMDMNLKEFKDFLTENLDLEGKQLNRTYFAFINEVERLIKIMD